jgi:hypothetical protein
MANRAAFAALVDASLDSTRASAEKWRTGLAALVTLVTTALLVKGPEAINNLPTTWRIAVTALLGIGLFLALVGLWLALSATSGMPSAVTYDAIMASHRSVKAFQISEANTVAKQLVWARIAAIAAMTLLVSGMLISWWAPRAERSTLLTVTTRTGSLCGELITADRGELRLTVTGEAAPHVIRFDDVVSMKVGVGCA